jgi:PAS domain S-box-containing protein
MNSDVYIIAKTTVVQCNIRDITERKRVEEALINSEKKYRNIFENATEGIFQSTPEGRYISINPAFAKIGGYNSPDEMMESVTNIKKIYVHQEDRTRLLELFNKHDIVTNFETEIRRRDNAIIWISMNVSAIRDRDRRIIFLEGTIQDVSEHKRAEEEIKKLNTELEQRVIDRTAQLEASNKELASFAYSVSHDLRAPLRGIDGWSLALLEDYGERLDDQARKYLHRVRAETQQMGRLIDDMLKLSRVTLAELQLMPIDLTAMGRSIATRLQEESLHRRIEFIIQPALKANGDSQLIDIALFNLFDNAVKFTGTRSHARIEFGEAEVDGGKAFFVHDDGVGFDMAHAPKLFGAFQRLHKSSEFPGTGVGLATVQRIIHRHGGRIWANAQVDQGATFYFTLKETI